MQTISPSTSAINIVSIVKHCSIRVIQLIFYFQSNSISSIVDSNQALGFLHEQMRPDRDEYVIVKWENIIPTTFNQFDKISNLTWNGYGEDYEVNYA